MRHVKPWRSVARAVLLPILALALYVGPAAAQDRGALQDGLRVPEPAAIEILVKQTLLSFNDANLTGNYAVFHATLSDRFRSQITAEQLAAAFMEFGEQQIDIGGGVILNRFTLSRPAVVNADGALELDGRFETRPLAINFVLHFLPGAGGEWRLANIKVDLAAPPAQRSGGQAGRRGR